MNKKNLIWIVPLLFLLVASSFASAEVFFNDTFDRADGALGQADSGQNWTTGSNWAITSNQAVGTGTTTTSTVSIGTIFSASNPANGINVSFRMGTTDPGDKYFLVGNGSGTDFVQIRFSLGGSDNVQVGNAGTFTNLQTVNGGQIYNITIFEINFASRKFKVMVDGVEYNNSNNLWDFRTGSVSGFNTLGMYGNTGTAYIDSITVYNATDSAPPPPAGDYLSIAFQGQTPSTGTNQYYIDNNFEVNTTITGTGGSVTTNQSLYNSSGSLLTTYSNNTQNTTNIFSGLNVGTYYFNATAYNSTNTNHTETRSINIYEMVQNGINTPQNGSTHSSQYLNITWNATTFNPTGTSTITNYVVELYNSDGTTLNTTLEDSTNSTFYYWDLYALGLDTGTYYIRITSNNSGNTVSQQQNFTLLTNALLNITVQNALNTTTLQNGSINITDGISNRMFNTTTGNFNIDVSANTNYSITADFTGYAITNNNITTNNTLQQYLNISLYTNNSIYIFIYDESTGSLITQNITIVVTGLTEETYSTTSGTLYLDNLPDGAYTIKLSGTNYSLTQYSVTVNDRSTQILNAYLSLESETVTFTILDFDSAAIIPGATFTQSRLINGSWTVIQSKTSDITGRVQVNYLGSVNYQFITSATGYETQIFYLNPVIFSTYNVRLQRTTTLTSINTPDYQGLSVNFNPTSFYNNRSHTFYWVISSPTGELSNYNLSLTYPGGNSLDSGTNAYGESFTKTFNITGANTSSQVIINYCYDTSTSSEKCFTYKYGVIGVYSNQSFLAAGEGDYQFGALDGVLIATIITLAISGLAFSVGGMIAGLPIALLLLGIFYYVGIISLWGVLPSILIGLFIIFGRTEGG